MPETETQGGRWAAKSRNAFLNLAQLSHLLRTEQTVKHIAETVKGSIALMALHHPQAVASGKLQEQADIPTGCQSQNSNKIRARFSPGFASLNHLREVS